MKNCNKVFIIAYYVYDNEMGMRKINEAGILAVLSSVDVSETKDFIERIREHALGYFDNYHDDPANYDWLENEPLKWSKNTLRVSRDDGSYETTSSYRIVYIRKEMEVEG